MSQKIHIKFEDKQEHQIRAIDSTVNLLSGLPKSETGFQLGDEIVPNLGPYAAFDEKWILANLNEVRIKNGMEENLFSLEMDEGFELEDVSLDSWRYPNFTIEMETGTGKTYVYLRSIMELRKNYGFRKFIIVVPSIAIYEGVIKNLEMTKSHFQALYDNERIHLTSYDGQSLSKLRTFASSSFTEVMVITIDSFNRKSNNIFKPTEKLPGERKPYQYIQETRPILILDEPQNMESVLAKSALRTLHPLFALRYSATHRTSPNLFYRLTPIEAFKRNLVKKIQVYGVKEEQNFNQYLLALEKIESYGLKAKIKTLINVKGETKEGEIEVKKGDDLYDKTHYDIYKDARYIVEEVNRGQGFVLFLNQEKLSVNEPIGYSKPQIFKMQIEETIERHMQTQEELKKKNIKVLSLFFIDRVANYTDDKNGIIRKIFDEAFTKIKKKYDHFKKMDAELVRSAYFAKKKLKTGGEEAIDTNGENEEQRKLEKEAFHLIMQDKERLLSFDEKVSFIFAHSALKEGWDNPNVFQICTLNETKSEMKKRQEIGRGLRICVNQTGERVMDEGVNVLTVIANDSYESYVRGLQMEYTEDGDIAPQKPSNARKDKSKRNEKIFKSKDFRTFWENLSKRTRYEINIDSEALIEKCIASVKAAQMPEPQIVVTKGKFVITEYKIELLSVSGKTAKLKVSITDTSGNEKINTYTFIPKSDLQKTFNDDRLKDYKILSIKDDGLDSEVEFNNGRILTKHDPIRFDSQVGQKIDSRVAMTTVTTYPVFNFVDRVARETGLTRPTINKIFKGLSKEKKESIFKNPEGFTSVFLNKIKETLADHIAERIEYVAESELEKYELEDVFPPLINYPQKEVLPGNEKSLYDQIQFDSEIEQRFIVNRLQKEDEVVLYFKFPGTFKIGIPKIIGNYNPDWGVIRFDEDKSMKLHLVRETKGNLDSNLLQFANEGRKISCAEKHFEALGMDYRVVTDQIPFWWKKKEK
ncbi:MAG: DEAD/DEAH box helicase family protein [Bacteroidota bacterium]